MENKEKIVIDIKGEVKNPMVYKMNQDDRIADLVKKAGYIIEENKEYIKEDYEKCATVISDYIMSHSKNDIPKIENEFRNILSKII